MSTTDRSSIWNVWFSGYCSSVAVCNLSKVDKRFKVLLSKNATKDKRKMLQFVTLVLLLVSLVRGQTPPPPPGYDSTNCGNNDCSTDKGGPICFDGKCVECNPKSTDDTNGLCMCGAGEYCVGDTNDKNFATCQSYGDPIGAVCDPALSAATVVKGKNEALFCGKVVFSSTDQTVDRVEWSGFCNAGTCQECSPGSSKCGGKLAFKCVLGNYHYAPADIFSWAYLFVNPVCFSTFWAWMWLYVFFPLTLIGIFICKKIGIC